MMKRSMFIGLCLAAAAMLVLSANIGMAGEFNAVQSADAQVDAFVASCWVSDTCGGSQVTQVGESGGTERMYWLNYTAGETVTFTKFIVKFTRGSVLKKQIQKFSFPSGYFGGTCTPFGVPFWGGDPIIGPAKLKVKSDVGACTYDFEVVK